MKLTRVEKDILQIYLLTNRNQFEKVDKLRRKNIKHETQEEIIGDCEKKRLIF